MASDSRGTKRPPRRAPALTGAAAVAVLLAGCTSGGPTAPRPSAVQVSASVPTMTAVPEAAQCVTHQNLGEGAGADLPFTDLFAGRVARGIDVNDEFAPGADATDAGRCGAVLPGGDDVWCGQPAPWASMGMDQFTIASGATRVRRVGITTDEGQSRPGRQVSRSLSYVELELGAADPKGLADFMQRAFRRCADGTVTQLQGLNAVTGVVPSMSGGVHEADAVAFLASKRVAWVILDGRPWTPAERKQALGAIAAHLRQA
ncbi:hypothetical protein [Terrabacter sp. BE26]|uniref:hypothetical protein n=1 Tax=Terrabacter sp. BE26 TaxID=2898152 RepID=UPI0035BE8E60